MSADLVTWLRAQLDDDEQVGVDDVGGMCDGGVHLDRDRWLREVDAKRKILDLTRFDAQFPDFDGGYDSACEDVIKLLGLAYAGRSGYREEWRP